MNFTPEQLNELDKIKDAVQSDYGMGGLSGDTLYGNYASDVAKRFASQLITHDLLDTTDAPIDMPVLTLIYINNYWVTGIKRSDGKWYDLDGEEIGPIGYIKLPEIN